jgi:hypothetical protein
MCPGCLASRARGRGPYPGLTDAELQAGLDLLPTWALTQKAAANRQVIAIMAQRLERGEPVVPMYGRWGWPSCSVRPRSPRNWSRRAAASLPSTGRQQAARSAVPGCQQARSEPAASTGDNDGSSLLDDWQTSPPGGDRRHIAQPSLGTIIPAGWLRCAAAQEVATWHTPYRRQELWADEDAGQLDLRHAKQATARRRASHRCRLGQRVVVRGTHRTRTWRGFG